jgi:hypothetical protein
MKHTLPSLILICISFLLHSGNDNLPLGARSAGLANASLTFNDVWSAHHNQAGLGFITKAAAGVTYENRFLLPELGMSAAVAAIPLNNRKGTFGFSIRKFGYQQYGETKIGLGFGRSFGENLSIGMQFNMQSVQFADIYGKRNAFTLEAGAIYKLSPSLTIAAHIFNPGRAQLTELDQDRIPVIIRLGMRYQFSKRLFIAVETEKDTYNKPVLKAGMEYMAGDILFLRAGVGSQPLSNAFGFGLKLKRMQVDMSGNFHPVLGFSPQFSLSYQFRD